MEDHERKIREFSFAARAGLGVKMKIAKAVKGKAYIDLSSDYSVKIENAIREVISSNYQATVNIDCEDDAPRGKEGEFSNIWIWRVIDEVENIKFTLPSMRCRYGKDANTAPECPP
jgi:hypothetical protein